MSGVRIKPLVWEDRGGDIGDGRGWLQATTPLCCCQIVCIRDVTGPAKAFLANVWLWKEFFPTEESAKDWCQETYERRVRECLVYEDDLWVDVYGDEQLRP